MKTFKNVMTRTAKTVLNATLNRYAMLVVVMLLACYGLVTAYNRLEDLANDRLDTYSVERVKSKHLLGVEVVTIEVPVLKAWDASVNNPQ